MFKALDALSAELTALGVGHHVERESSLARLIFDHRRICVSGLPIYPQESTGRFTLYVGEGVAFLCLFSGFLYRLDPKRAAAVTAALYARHATAREMTPWRLPAELAAEHDLQEGDIFYTVPDSDASSFTRALATTPPRTRPWPCAPTIPGAADVRIDSGGLVTIELRCGRALLTRLLNARGRPTRYLACFLSGRLAGASPECISDLQELAKFWH